MNTKGFNLFRTVASRGVLLTPLALAGFALSPIARAEDEDLPNQNTAEGKGALFSLTTGVNNTAVGFHALHSDTEGSFNTATGANALLSNTTGRVNAAFGADALLSNTTGRVNAAFGASSLFSNTTGIGNTAAGIGALYSNTTGSVNTAIGISALENNTTGELNEAIGYAALINNTTGSENIAVGVGAGAELTIGNHNIDIGNVGVPGESNAIRIGTQGTQTRTFIAGISGAPPIAKGVTVQVGAHGRLGPVVSSERFKDTIKPMDKLSEAILALRPVTFRYKHEFDPDAIPQFGLVAEQVEKVNPDLVTRDEQGKVYRVRYEAVNAMLLNEFLKEHRKVEEQEATISQVKSTVAKQEATIAQQQKDFQVTVAKQQKEIKALTASLKEQASQIQKVSDQLEVSKPAPRVVVNNQ